MGIFDIKTFKSGNSIALRLPKALGIGENIAMTLEQHGTTLTIKRSFDPAEEKRKLHAFVEVLRTAGPPIVPVEVRDADIFPDRPGL